MIRVVGRALGRGLAVLAVLIALPAVPVLWVELSCTGEPVAETHVPLLPASHRRAESRTLMTYPEWHIVHVYDDYAKVIETGDPHDFAFGQAIRGFWSSLCALNRAAAAHGGATRDSKMTIHTIGVSFTLEMVLKAAYEETLGRAATWIRGAGRAPLDDLSARQAADYAAFLQQVPWYKWDFAADAGALGAQAGDTFRDRERAVALGLEYRAKAAYARAIDAAVGQMGGDALRLRSVVSGLGTDVLSAMPDVAVSGTLPEGTVIETPRYRAFTRIAGRLAAEGADFVEIAGNDDILVTTIAPRPVVGALHAFARQGYGDVRNLRLIRVSDLAATLRALDGTAERLEHIHDY